MNFAREVVDKAPAARPALIALGRAGKRVLSFGEVADRSARLAGTLAERGVARGDVVMMVVGNRPEWVLATIACFRIGAVAFPCTEQLREPDLRRRLELVEPRVVLADERNLATVLATGFDKMVLSVPDERLFDSGPVSASELAAQDPALVIFTSGTSGEPKPVWHGQRYLFGQRLQAEHWYDAREGDLCWCTAASGWSKSVRNGFIAPWLQGATALLSDARFDPYERLETVEREGVNVVCMAPTEYRSIARATDLRPLSPLRHAVAAGELLDADTVQTWREGAGIEIHDGYGQTETGALTGMPIGRGVRPGSMGRALPGIRLWIDAGELCVDSRSVPTFAIHHSVGTWRTGDRVRQTDDGYLWFEGRGDDIIISAGYRIGPFEVESALLSHPAVAEAAAVAMPDELRGSVVRAVVVPRGGVEPGVALVRELQEHVKSLTAPYKYPRVIEFTAQLPKTASGKIKHAQIRREGAATELSCDE